MRSSSSRLLNDSIAKRSKKPVACRRCHTHKVKCSGGHPCAKCRNAGCAADCTYVDRDRQIKVHESYLNQLAAENARLREQLSQSPGFTTPEDNTHITIADGDTHVQNPLIGERAWFQPYDPSASLIYIGEAACTAFGTRLRQVLTEDKTTTHMPRTQYTSESTLIKLRSTAPEWPSLPRARLLIKIVISQVSQVYHLFLCKSTTEELEEAYRQATFDDSVLTCKLFAIFALGEVYSARSNPSLECRVPGAAYYVNAMTLIPILPERPSLTHIESLLLMSLYSYFLNRRNSAFLLVGNALRLGLTLGLNHDIPESQCPDPVDRQHRIRLWWAMYVFDRMYGSKAGWPIQIADDDIHVEMPTPVSCDPHGEQFSDTQFSVASIQLAGITGQIIEKIYSRKKQPDSFLQREQKLLMALKQWAQALPSHLRLTRDGPNPKNIVSLHLQLNQCIMLATRPILLYTLIQLRKPCENKKNPAISSNNHTLRTLADACMHAARHTHSLIVEEWTNGSLPIFGEINPEHCSDYALFETALEILRAMSDHGNLAATEFRDNLECVRQCLDTRDKIMIQGSVPINSLRPSNHSVPNTIPFHTDAATGRRSEISTTHTVMADRMASGSLTDEMGFLNQSMEDFLAQTDVDLGPFDPSGVPINMADAVGSWPNSSLWTG